MTDQKTPSAGDPVEEPTRVDDVVGHAHEGLADAEAAGRDATGEQTGETVVEEEIVVEAVETPVEPAAAEPVVIEETVVVEEVVEPVAAPTTVEPVVPVAAPAADDDVPWYDRPESVPLDPEPVPVVAPAPQPIFVQAPEAPRPRGNRGAAGLIGLLAALGFAVLSFGVLFAFGFIYGGFGEGAGSAVDYALAIVQSWTFWVPIVVFYFAFWLLGAILNRARWAHWVIWGLLVGVASYGGSLLGLLFQAPFWELTARQGAELLEGSLFSPLPILAFVLGRELTVWFGAWVSARGRRVTEENEQAQREYERTLEAGPQLHHA